MAFPASRTALFLCITVKMTPIKKREWEKVGRKKGRGEADLIRATQGGFPPLDVPLVSTSALVIHQYELVINNGSGEILSYILSSFVRISDTKQKN